MGGMERGGGEREREREGEKARDRENKKSSVSHFVSISKAVLTSRHSFWVVVDHNGGLAKLPQFSDTAHCTPVKLNRTTNPTVWIT